MALFPPPPQAAPGGAGVCARCAALVARVCSAGAGGCALALAARTGGLAEEHGGVRVPPFNVHLIFMVFAYAVAMSEGVLAWATWERGAGYTHAKAKRAHALFNSLAVVFAVVGLIGIFRNHGAHAPGWEPSAHPPLYSAHSWVGIAAAAATLGAAVYGIGAFVVGDALGFTAEAKARAVPFHRAVALFAYFGGLLAMAMGVQEKQGFTACPDGGARCTNKTILGMLSLFILVLGAAVAARLGADTEAKRTELDERARLIA